MSTKVPIYSVSFQHSFNVQTKHLDKLNHVNNVVYLQWVNDIAEKHWSILSNDSINKNYYWVAIRHEIDYLNQAFLEDEITVYTWVGESKGVKSIRHVHIYNEEILLAKAQSTWCLIDAKTNKLTRIKQDILDLISVKK